MYPKKLIVTVLAVAASCMARSSADVVLVQDGPSGVIALRSTVAGGDELAAAKLIQDYVRRATGTELPIRDEAKLTPSEKPVLYVGRGIFVDTQLGERLNTIDPDGFILKTGEGFQHRQDTF